ncbi:hypothetical protein PoB_005883400 [Plakobranchus ocellatus]|uniref:Uncharacterized protein n=1 Tax=Plakobranchus ocellatus TaxID=259542 RepID=A0AAV4CHU4_9GAST|nr:hypothetical protein PoB_005883400 [Plakobranchus ocellatus]
MKPSASTYLYPNTHTFRHKHSQRKKSTLHTANISSRQEKLSTSIRQARAVETNPSSRTTKRNQDQSTRLPVELQCSSTIEAKPLSSPVGIPSYRNNPQKNATQITTQTGRDVNKANKYT